MIGYSRLVAEYELETISGYRTLFQELLEPSVKDAQGRVFKTLGDGFLADFSSASSAVECAVGIQGGVSKRGMRIGGQTLSLRIGIHLGETIEDGDDLLGDTVNIASRLEAIASPGGICVSSPVYERVRNETSLRFRSIGPQRLKNIPGLVKVWQVDDPAAPAPKIEQLSGRPSIVVLPFDNLSSAPDQDFFADGLVEDITTALSRFTALFVVARNSAFAYQGAARNLRNVGRELGVRFAVEGSVRCSGRKIRVSAQLIETETGMQVWANRWDRDISDLFTVQDELTTSIVGVLEPEIRKTVRNKALQRPIIDLNAWELVHRGWAELSDWTPDGLERGKSMFQQAIKLDPEFADAYGWLAVAYANEVAYGFTNDIVGNVNLGVETAKRCQALQPHHEGAQYALGFLLAVSGAVDDALAMLELAIERNPNNVYLYLARALARQFKTPVDGAKISQDGMNCLRRSPNDLGAWSFYFMIAFGRMLDDPRDPERLALQAIEQACNQQYTGHPALMLAAVLAVKSKPDLAKRRLDQVLELYPGLSAASFKGFWDDPAWELLMENSTQEIALLVSLGLPESN